MIPSSKIHSTSEKNWANMQKKRRHERKIKRKSDSICSLVAGVLQEGMCATFWLPTREQTALKKKQTGCQQGGGEKKCADRERSGREGGRKAKKSGNKDPSHPDKLFCRIPTVHPPKNNTLFLLEGGPYPYTPPHSHSQKGTNEQLPLKPEQQIKEMLEKTGVVAEQMRRWVGL